MYLEITIAQIKPGTWVATYESNVPQPAVADGKSPQEAMTNLSRIINYEDIH